MAGDEIAGDTLRDYGQEQWPLLVRGALESWPSFHWTLADWADRIDQETALTFRVHRRSSADQIEWENEALDYVEAYLSELIEHVKDQSQALSGGQSESGRGTTNPFQQYSLGDYCFYTSYNHMKKLFSSKSDVIRSVRWQESGLGEPKLRNDALESTLWIGTKGAHTPCHQDSYGYNFVAQLYGKKLWILFPPSDTNRLYPTRIPFEESSVFSQINFKWIDLNKFPLFASCQPRIVELEPGDILFVPRHWWHYVENQSEVSISINCWINSLNDDQDSYLLESLAQFIARPLFDAYSEKTSDWINFSADLFSSEQALKTLVLLLNQSSKQKESQNETKEECKGESEFKRKKIIQLEPLPALTLEELAKIKPIKFHTETKHVQDSPLKAINAQDIVNAILQPDVINLIKVKLIDLQQRLHDS